MHVQRIHVYTCNRNNGQVTCRLHVRNISCLKACAKYFVHVHVHVCIHLDVTSYADLTPACVHVCICTVSSKFLWHNILKIT